MRNTEEGDELYWAGGRKDKTNAAQGGRRTIQPPDHSGPSIQPKTDKGGQNCPQKRENNRSGGKQSCCPTALIAGVEKTSRHPSPKGKPWQHPLFAKYEKVNR